MLSLERVLTLPRDLIQDQYRTAGVCLGDLDMKHADAEDYGSRRRKLCEWLNTLQTALQTPRTVYDRLLEDSLI